ncbi:hypothetical protein LEP1GSC058_1356 [Leptospira fainei serovar Hurstbridge str. BUT 6]|uniref:Uncharacterized protein n=1 Tax=Leptospira fainei serovar Hurstbridge str. BUT 6 TaxID=1193011 RepID=S3V0M9_9LEPT|nr:hypothetical protein LEP1GSC058_1356 [Leptospira fainei serovar Hurstbridge str. BUT 6]
MKLEILFNSQKIDTPLEMHRLFRTFIPGKLRIMNKLA